MIVQHLADIIWGKVMELDVHVSLFIPLLFFLPYKKYQQKNARTCTKYQHIFKMVQRVN